jgi:hypothetical protein
MSRPDSNRFVRAVFEHGAAFTAYREAPREDDRAERDRLFETQRSMILASTDGKQAAR